MIGRLFAAAVLAAAAWPGLDMLWRGRALPRLSAVASDLAEWPRVSVVVAARNEAEGVRAGVGSLLAQDYPGLEVIVVDDRSTDATAAVVAELGAHVISIQRLPPGWLGKPHALWTGAQRSHGEWVLFTDADVVLRPDCVRRAVAYAASEGLDHLTLGPLIRARGWWLSAFVAFFSYLLLLSLRLYRVNDPDSRVGVGLGAFNLLRRQAYDAIGTYAAVARRPDDDVKLGQRVRDLGLRQQLLDGTDLVSVEWYPSLGAAIRGLEKNFFAGYDYRVSTAVVSLGLLLLTHVWPWLAVWRSRGLWFVTIAVNVATFLSARARLGARPGPAEVSYALAIPMTALLVTFTALRSMLITLHQGGIRWRDTFYPLSDLRG